MRRIASCSVTERLELHRGVFQASAADVIYDVVLEVRRDLFGHRVLRLIAQQPDLQAIAIYTVIFCFLHKSDAGDTLCLVVRHSLTVPADHVVHERVPNELQRVNVLDVTEVQTQLGLVAFIFESGLDAMLEHHERSHLVRLALEIVEHLELVAVAEDLADVRMRQTVPHLMERYNVVEPGDLAAQLVVVVIRPGLLRALIVDELPDGPFDTLHE